VFDPARLRHRLEDTADWWTWPAGVLEDLNSGNVLPFELGSDGVYVVTVHLDEERPSVGVDSLVSGLVGCDSGFLFIGPGEQITAEGLEPDVSFGGVRLPCPNGSLCVWVTALGDGELEMWLERITGPPINHFTTYPRLPKRSG
jgi:hypothetical protein